MKRPESTPAVSIVLLSLLRKKDTSLCIHSIQKYSDQPYEIIVVDMGQSEEIVEWLQQLSFDYENIKVIFNDKNVGTTKGRNQAAKIAAGQYIVFLDNDVELQPGWLEPLIQRADSSGDIAACGSKISSSKRKVLFCDQFVKAEYEKEKLKEIGVEFKSDYKSSDPIVNIEKEVPWYPSTCLLVKKTAFEAVVGFDEKIFFCEEDKDLCLRIRKLGLKIFYVPESEVYHHHKPPAPEYAKIRNALPMLIKDIKYFKNKWQCDVFIRHTRKYLHQSGMGDPEIDRIKRFSFLNTILEEKMELKELILTVTNICNHRCGMCYYHENLNKKTKELSLDEYRKVSSSLGDLNTLWISGGEPFLRKDLAEICRLFIEKNQVKNIFIPTNGSQPEQIVSVTRQLIEQNEDVKLYIMFSLEGRSAVHDEIHGVGGAFASVEEAIKKLNFLRVRLFKQKRYFSILLNSVVSEVNMKDMIPLMEYVKGSIMVDSHTLTPMRGEGRDSSHKPPTGNDFLALYNDALPYMDFYARKAGYKSEKLDEFQAWMNRRYKLWADILLGHGLPFQCQAGRLIGVLEPDGGVRICESKPVVANVCDWGFDFQRAWFSAMVDKCRDGIEGCSCTHACFLNISENTCTYEANS